jgi:hypothetical protein
MSHPTDSSTNTHDLLAFIERFLTALSDPDGGEVLYEMHASNAAVRYASAIRRASDVDCESFSRAHREINVHGRDILPSFGSPALLQAPLNFSDVESVAWFEVTETRESRKLIAALGLRTQAGVRRIGWCTLATRVETWSYGDGLLQSLADYPWMRRAEPAMARALLDASYFRRYWREPVTFTALPDARFGCHMSTACCKHDFEITLPPEAQLLIDAIPWQTVAPRLLGTRLKERPDGKLQLKELNETCRFLGARGQCLIHQTLGRQPFGPCSVFPYAFAQTPEGIAVSLSPICGSTRLGLGLALLDREDDLREKLVQAEPRQPKGFRLTPQMEIPWESFRDIEKTLCDCLATEYLPMRRRLYVGTRLLGALSRNEPLDLNCWLQEPLVEITSELREVIRGMLSKILAWDRAALRTLPPTIPSELFNLEVRDSPVVARILRYVVYSKVYSYPFDLTTAHNLLIVLYLLTIIMQSAFSGPLPDVMWQELGSLGVHGPLRNVLHDGVPEGFRALFGTSEFGQWMLAA